MGKVGGGGSFEDDQFSPKLPRSSWADANGKYTITPYSSVSVILRNQASLPWGNATIPCRPKRTLIKPWPCSHSRLFG